MNMHKSVFLVWLDTLQAGRRKNLYNNCLAQNVKITKHFVDCSQQNIKYTNIVSMYACMYI